MSQFLANNIFGFKQLAPNRTQAGGLFIVGKHKGNHMYVFKQVAPNSSEAGDLL